MDSGNSLESDAIAFIPTAQYERNVIKKGRLNISTHDWRTNQSAQLLQQHYGTELDASIVGVDAFYALHGLFRFTAFSEAQFLNLMETQLEKRSSSSSETSRTSILKNFQNNQSILRQHVDQLQETLEVIQRRGNPKWPKAKQGSAERKALTAADQLENDFHYLRYRAQHLANMYTDAIATMQHNMLIQQSQKNAILIRNVLIMLLLIFTTSFFGMNFKQFGVGTLQLWVYPAVALPLFILSLFAVMMNQTVQRSVYTYYAKLWAGMFGNRLKWPLGS